MFWVQQTKSTAGKNNDSETNNIPCAFIWVHSIFHQIEMHANKLIYLRCFHVYAYVFNTLAVFIDALMF